MGCMLRSDPMSFCELYLQPEAAFYILSRLGEIGCVQFKDMTPDMQAFQRNYITEVCRYADLEHRLKSLESEMIHHDIKPVPIKDEPYAMTIKDMSQFEQLLEKWEDDVLKIAQNDLALMKSYLEVTELYYVLTYIGPLLGEAEIFKRETRGSKKAMAKRAAAAGDIGIGGRLMVITGVINRSSSFAFERMLWRISHGIIYYRSASEDKILIDPNTRHEIRKVAFLAVCQGEQLTSRVEKICNGFRVNMYPCPHTYNERQEMILKLEARIADLEQVLKKTRYLRCKALRQISRQWQYYMTQVRKSKGIYFIMNHFTLDITKKCLIGQCWIPDTDIPVVQHILKRASDKFETNVPSFMSKADTHDCSPTYHRTNKFTRGFQNLINAYGDSAYKELNPGLYTIITFPFLFAIMFGDVGHGLILFVFGCWMWKNEAKFIRQPSNSEIWNIFFGGRYIILLMGLFSIFTGFVYNDMFSKAMSITKSAWINKYSVDSLIEEEYRDWDPKLNSRVYQYGVDPIWALAKNKIMFENSIKMKFSIIIGVLHMIFGVVLSYFNHRYFKRNYLIFLQFIPELLFFTLIFFWLVVLIYYKWFTYAARSSDPELGSACAPQILIIFIDMVLFSKTKPAVEGCEKSYMFEGQRILQMGLMVAALICVPIMLFGSPLYLRRINNKERKIAENNLKQFQDSDEEDPRKENFLIAEVEKYSHSFAEIMIHQGIHTIEFVLGTISHTASYLRLWALSLAHAQLSEMLWQMIFSQLALRDHSSIGVLKVFVVFAIWAVFTVSILVLMEGLSAFLHTLRLHWVEFMSKFYHGGGYPFRPFAFQVLLAADDKIGHRGCKTGTEKN